MPRVYTRTPGSRRYRDYTDETLAKAIGEVKRGHSVSATSTKYGIPRKTLRNKIKGTHCNQHGGQKRLSDEAENALLTYIVMLTNWLIPLGGLEIRLLARDYQNSRHLVNVFADNLPGTDWLSSFMRRHNLTKRIADNVRRSRAHLTPKEVSTYFDHLEKELAGLPPTHIFNYDETNVSDDPGSKTVIVSRGLKRVERMVCGDAKSSTSVMFCGNANGDYLPPMTVYKCESGNIYSGWKEGGPRNAVYEATASGWFDKRTFAIWFFRVFLPYVSNLDGPIALIGDNLGSHFSADVIAVTIERSIKFITMPPASTHVCQPLDVAVFRTLKRSWRKILNCWRKESRCDSCIPKEQIPSLLRQLCDNLEPGHIKSGFKATGIYPIDRSQVLKRLPGKRNTDTGGEDTERIFSENVMNMLRDNCGQSASYVRKSRGRKITPGKRIVTLEQAKKKKKRTKEDGLKEECGECSLPWDSDGDDRWIRCEDCDQWYHLRCSGISYEGCSYDELDIESIAFTCYMC